MNGKRAKILALIAALALVGGCGAKQTQGTQGGSAAPVKPYAPEVAERPASSYSPQIEPYDFVKRIDNPYFPLRPGTTLVYEGKTREGIERTEFHITRQTKEIMGVECTVVRDRVFLDGELIEDTFDWHAQDKEGNVWYFGENTKEYENGKVVSTEGSWKAGVDGAKPGIVMQANPRVGDSYRQEYYRGHAEDMAEVLSTDASGLNDSVSVPYGSFHNVLMTKEWSPLEANVLEYKYYAAGVGEIGEEGVLGEPGQSVLVSVKGG
ncbi:hypothetical protein Rxycam_02504 [Rubrobacter xylanophilus DSM 9941]|uniref:hypothetical protein n=1 Tax=Rubrobacter xylanophilus TaxID=49319 RepID=UPI001C63DDCE|nr:hypothetical protein [Rubrobacter xylanophilus]QYJ16669.1 hypothetical protein Rxycam_02504 [Rubrobacter xylanophilus DSM 9941]